MFKNTQIRQLDHIFDEVRQLRHIATPRMGWLHAIRTALGMPLNVLASKSNKSAEAIRMTEKREAEETITLATLRSAASELDCDLFYVIIPRKQLDETLRHAAEAAANNLTAGTSQTMGLEDQSVSSSFAESSRSDLVDELMRNPRLIWKGQR
jgi:predicted DNA-binding mobile mystery protein A